MKHAVLAVGICVTLYMLLFAVSRCAANAQNKEVVVNVPDGVETSETGCDSFTKITRESLGKGGVRVNVSWEIGKFDEVRVKFLADDGGLPSLLRIERHVINGTAFTVHLALPKYGTEHKVHVYVEGVVGDDIKARCNNTVAVQP